MREVINENNLIFIKTDGSKYVVDLTPLQLKMYYASEESKQYLFFEKALEIFEQTEELYEKLKSDKSQILASSNLLKLDKSYSQKMIKLYNLQAIRYCVREQSMFSRSLISVTRNQTQISYVEKHPLIVSFFNQKKLDKKGKKFILVPCLNSNVGNLKRYAMITKLQSQLNEIELEMEKENVLPTAKSEDEIEKNLECIKILTKSK